MKGEGKLGRVLIMAGGTGGHVFPGLALATELLKRGHGVEWLGTRKGIESQLVPEAGLPLHVISVEGIRGKRVKSLLKAPIVVLRSIIEAIAVLRKVKPSLVVGFGGFASGPGGVAAKMLRLPLIIHEQNAVAGTTNKILAKLANKVLCAFPGVLPGALHVGNPVREEIEHIPKPEQRFFQRRKGRKILIIGGSRGASAINNLLPESLQILMQQQDLGDNQARFGEIEIWHQAGEKNCQALGADYALRKVEAKIEAFISDMAAALAWADLVVCRAGALTVSELAAAGVGAIFIPFPYAIDDHQTANAQYLVGAEAAEVYQQARLSAQQLAQVLEEKLSKRETLLRMAIRAREKSMPDVARIIADICEEQIYV